MTGPFQGRAPLPCQNVEQGCNAIERPIEVEILDGAGSRSQHDHEGFDKVGNAACFVLDDGGPLERIVASVVLDPPAQDFQIDEQRLERGAYRVTDIGCNPFD
jgi:hypothetical protein